MSDPETEVFQPGDRVDIHDPGSTSGDGHQPATVVAAETRRDGQESRPGYRIRYDNGCEVWVREWRVRAPRKAAPIPAGSMTIEVDSRRNLLMSDRLPADAIGQMSIVTKYGDGTTVTLTAQTRDLLVAALAAL